MNSYEKQIIEYLRKHKNELNTNDFVSLFKPLLTRQDLSYYYLEKILVNANITFTLPGFKTGEIWENLNSYSEFDILQFLNQIDLEINYGETVYTLVIDEKGKHWIKCFNDAYDNPEFIDKENACKYIANTIYDNIAEDDPALYDWLFKFMIDGKDDQRIKRLMNNEPIQSIPALHYDTETDIGEYIG